MSVMHTNLEDTKEEKKYQFLRSVKSWSLSYDEKYDGRFSLDKDIEAAYRKVIEADNEMALICKRKLEEAGIK